MTRSVDMGSEKYSLSLDFPERCKREYLESTRIGENIVLPRHKTVQSPGVLDDIYAGSEIEMIGVAENHADSQLIQIFHCNGLDGGVGTNRHERRGLNSAVSEAQLSISGACRLIPL